MNHKAGFVNIIGNPNVGKSTMMNALVGENLSIITSKAQTTRHRILGIVNDENYQIVFSDLPGILKPHYKLQEKMLHFIEVAIQDADVFLYMVEAGETKVDEEIAQKIIQSKKPVVVLINKIDLSTQEEIMVQIQHWSEIFSGSQVIPISALNNFNLEKVKDVILDMLPENPPYFPKDELTDKHMRFFVAEIIREKILLNFKQEVPYSVEVVVDQYKEEENLTRIFAYIYVARESQKMIILGKQGRAIKKLGTDARLDIEKFIDQKVFLELTVKVLKDWRDNDKQLKRLGYEN
ncbi:MAG TPA: GTPase Era [Bacteroidales bacterium]|nr:GTPase Era [Bacteroidales bacterium]HPE54916.1 GTPase Era [Bacteroidales bacterium]HRX97073.1 GTPase Era [Bacteroidales bacterium]